MGIDASLKMIFTSKYLGLIAVLVICYGMSMNFVELLWKQQLKLQFETAQGVNNYMQNLFIGTGIFTMFVMLTSKGIVQKFGWFKGAIVTPLVILFTGGVFFAFAFFGDFFSPLVTGLGVSALLFSVWIGTIQNILSKGVKYGLFDPTKEMAYIPLDDDAKSKGKAAVDVIGGRLGKAGGGFVASSLMIITAGGTSDIAPFLAIGVVIMVIVWLFAVASLSKLYEKKVEEKE